MDKATSPISKSTAIYLAGKEHQLEIKCVLEDILVKLPGLSPSYFVCLVY